MPSIQCPECGKELHPQGSGSLRDHCICTQCGRDVYVHGHVKSDVKCPTCGKVNKKDVTV